MAQIQKLEVVHEAKCCPDKLYRMLTRDASQLSKYIPNLVESVEITATREGEVCLGTGFVWKFMPGKELCDAINPVTFTLMKDILTNYLRVNNHSGWTNNDDQGEDNGSRQQKSFNYIHCHGRRFHGRLQ